MVKQKGEKKMRRIQLAVLFGGCSNEYHVSLRSAAAVLEHLNRAQYDIIMVGITRRGEWFRYEGELEAIREDRWHQLTHCCLPISFSPSRSIRGILEWRDQRVVTVPIDLAFPVLHGKNGEDGSVQALLDLCGIPYVGCGMVSSVICMDKAIAHTLVRAAGIPTATSIILYAGDDLKQIWERIETMTFPLFVKPAKSGSSIGITKVVEKNGLVDAIQRAFQHDDKVVIEEEVAGIEVGCAVLGDAADPFMGEIDEIELLSTGFFDYEEKYALNSAKIHLPARLDDSTVRKIKTTAHTIYKILGCQGLARVDLFLKPDGTLLFNEVNTMPGFTAHSRYPQMMEAAGLSFGELLDRLIEMALAKGERAYAT